MCMSSVYEHRDGNLVLICDSIKAVNVQGDTITCVDIMGFTTVICGRIQNVDLERNTMIIEPGDQMDSIPA